MSLSARDRIESIWRGSAPAPLGKRGFALPDIAGFAWHQIGEQGADNWAVAPEGSDWKARREITVSRKSRGNVIIYGVGSQAVGAYTLAGNDNTIIFGEHNHQLVQLSIHVNGMETVTFFGSRSTCVGAVFFVHGTKTVLSVGEDCMFSHGIVIRTSDSHSIVDLDTGRWVNPIESVRVDPYVWLCPFVTVLKGVRIGFGSIVAERSTVTSDVGRCVLVGGVPARVLRERVSWDREIEPRPGIHKEILARRDQYD